MIKSITTLAIAAFALSAFAQQSQTVKIKSRGEDIRTVIDTIFEQTGKQYVLETNFHQSLYMNLEGISFQKAIEIISHVTDMEFEEKQGIWYIHRKPITAAHTFVPDTKIATLAANKPEPKKNLTSKTNLKTKAPAKSTPVKPSTTKKVTQNKVVAKDQTAAQGFATITTPIETTTPKVSLTGRLTVSMKKMDIREVFAEFARQGKVDIEFDDSVPNYKLDASFYNTTLKFALDKVCKVAHLKYTVTPTNTLRISKI